MKTSVQFSLSVVSDSLQYYGLQHARPPCPTPTPGVYLNSCPLSRWCHPTISSSVVVPFSSRLQSFPASGSFPMSQFFASGGQNFEVSASASVLPMNIQDWFLLGWTGWISLQSKGLSRVFSNTIVQKHQTYVLLKSWASQVTLVVKNLPADAGNVRDAGSIPGLRGSPGEGDGNPLEYSCLENLMGRGAWQATDHGVSKIQTRLKWSKVFCRMFIAALLTIGKNGWNDHVVIHTTILGNKKEWIRDLPGGPGVKNLPSNAGVTSWLPGQKTKMPHAMG